MYGAPQFGNGFSVPPKPVGIFWDIENCPVPKGKLASGLIHHVRNFFIHSRLNHREFEFLISCDVTRIRKDIPEDINRAGGVTLAHVSGSSKNAADEKLRESMRKFMDTHGHTSPMLILISGDIDFVNDLRGYQTRLGCHVIIIYGSTSSPHFKQGWNEAYFFQDFCSAVAPQGQPAGVPSLHGNASNRTESNPKAVPGGIQGNGQRQGDKCNGQKGQHGQAPPIREKKPSGEAGKKDTRKHPEGQPGHFGSGQNSSHNNMKQSGQKGPGNPGANQSGGYNYNKQGPPGGPKGSKGPKKPIHSEQPCQVPHQNNNKKQHFGPNGATASAGLPRSTSGQHLNKSSSQEKLAMNGPSTQGDGTGKPDNKKKDEYILMVSGLPGKMDFKILKEHLQHYASTVNGRVKFVKNGQGFITFVNVEDMQKAIELFQGKEVYGKKLVLSVARKIPFDPPPPAGGSPGAAGTSGGAGIEASDAGWVDLTDFGSVLAEIGSQMSKGKGPAGKKAAAQKPAEDVNCCIQ